MLQLPGDFVPTSFMPPIGALTLDPLGDSGLTA